MSEDRRVNLRGAFYEVVEAAATARHLSVAAFVTSVVGEYLRTCGELHTRPTAATNNVSSNRPVLTTEEKAELEVVWGTDDDD